MITADSPEEAIGLWARDRPRFSPDDITKIERPNWDPKTGEGARGFEIYYRVPWSWFVELGRKRP